MESEDKAAAIIEEACALAAEAIRYQFGALVHRCESPIERLLLAQIVAENVNADPFSKIQLFSREFVFGERHVFPIESTDLWLQARVADYRVDFLFDCLTPTGERATVVVECDGHDFHERTKEQARRDKARDRFMVGLGIKVLRFTGSEIYRDSESVFAEIGRHLPGGESFSGKKARS